MFTKNWQNAVLKGTDTMARAIEVLEENKLLGIGLVLDENGKLIGTVTDGDIRRALINRHSMDAQVNDLMNPNPAVAITSDTQQSIKNIMQESFVARVPVVDKNQNLVSVAQDEVIDRNLVVDNPVLLMAGGYGRRLRPLTLKTPKPLLRVGDKPVLEIMLEQLVGQGFHNFYVSVHYKANSVRSYFGDGSKWGVGIRYLQESLPLGTAGALGLLADQELLKPLIVINGDLVTRVEYVDLLKFHQEQSGVATLCVREYDVKVPYGVIETDAGRVVRIVEKPVQRFFVNAGIYVIEPTVIEEVSAGLPKDMPELLQQQIDRGQSVNFFPIHEYWLDIGGMPDYERAQEDVKTNR